MVCGIFGAFMYLTNQKCYTNIQEKIEQEDLSAGRNRAAAFHLKDAEERICVEYADLREQSMTAAAP